MKTLNNTDPALHLMPFSCLIHDKRPPLAVKFQGSSYHEIEFTESTIAQKGDSPFDFYFSKNNRYEEEYSQSNDTFLSDAFQFETEKEPSQPSKNLTKESTGL